MTCRDRRPRARREPFGPVTERFSFLYRSTHRRLIDEVRQYGPSPSPLIDGDLSYGEVYHVDHAAPCRDPHRDTAAAVRRDRVRVGQRGGSALTPATAGGPETGRAVAARPGPRRRPGLLVAPAGGRVDRLVPGAPVRRADRRPRRRQDRRADVRRRPGPQHAAGAADPAELRRPGDVLQHRHQRQRASRRRSVPRRRSASRRATTRGATRACRA